MSHERLCGDIASLELDYHSSKLMISRKCDLKLKTQNISKNCLTYAYEIEKLKHLKTCFIILTTSYTMKNSLKPKTLYVITVFYDLLGECKTAVYWNVVIHYAAKLKNVLFFFLCTRLKYFIVQHINITNYKIQSQENRYFFKRRYPRTSQIKIRQSQWWKTYRYSHKVKMGLLLWKLNNFKPTHLLGGKMKNDSECGVIALYEYNDS